MEITLIEELKVNINNRLEKRRGVETLTLLYYNCLFMHELLDFTDKCAPDSEIERIMAIHLLDWVRKQSNPYFFRIVPQFPVPNDETRHIDFVITYENGPIKFKVAVECDGIQGLHKTPEMMYIDNVKDQLLKSDLGISTVRFTSEQIYKMPEACIDRMECAMRILLSQQDLSKEL